jgi:predicted secreted protein
VVGSARSRGPRLAALLLGTVITVIGVLAAAAPAGAATDQPERAGHRYTLRVQPLTPFATLSQAIHPGDVLSVAVDENPSTGYSWSASVPMTANGALRYLNTSFVAAPHPPGLVGSGGTEYFHYRAVRPGTALIELTLWPPGTGLTAANRVDLNVNITR